MAASTKKVTDGQFVAVQSGSDPSVTYRVFALGSPKQWCECPKYKFQRKPVSDRECSHTRKLKALGVVLPVNA